MSAADVNTVASFLAAADEGDIFKASTVDCLVICASSVLHTAETVFKALQQRPELAQVVVLCGGVGHTTKLMYEAISRNPKYAHLCSNFNAQTPEAQMLLAILQQYGPTEHVLVEDRSTNCGANGTCTWQLLQSHNIHPRTMLIAQDATMSLRTLASFQKAFAQSESPPESIRACPTFVPVVESRDGALAMTPPNGCTSELWTMNRFLDLILGEIPRLRDDANGYGPGGKGFIGHVDIPDEVLSAWARLVAAFPDKERLF